MRTSASNQGRGGGRLGRRAGWVHLGVVGAAAALIASDAACSLIVDTNADQCTAATVANDCGGFPGLRSCQQGVCQVATTAPTCSTNASCGTFAKASCSGGVCVQSCTTSADCGTGSTCNAGACGTGTPGNCKVNADCAKMGTYYVCRKDTLQCVNLESSLCPTVYGDYKNDEAFLFGAILPISGPDMSTGVPLQNAMELAVNDFAQNANGLPPVSGQTAHRPLAFVGCTDNSDSATAVTAAQHLAHDVGVPAIVGAAFSGITIAVANMVTIDAKVMLFSPSATSIAITDLDSSVPRLVWRTSPPDTFQASALSLYMSQPNTGLEAQVRKTLNLMPSDNIKVSILHKGDSYGNLLAEALAGKLTFNGKPALGQAELQNLDYGNPDGPGDPTKYPTQVAATLAQEPHVIFVIGTTEGVQSIFEPIDKGWTNSSYYPIYVFSDGGQVPELYQYVATAKSPGSSTLRSRVSGSVPGTNNLLFQAFLSQYNGAFTSGDPTVFGAAGTYNIVYMLGYAATSLLAPGVKNTAVNGSDLAAGMAALVPMGTSRTELDVGGSNVNTAFGSLISGTGIDFNGASGPLNFNLKTGEAPSDIQIWCINQSATNEVASGLYFDAATSTLTGAFTACN